jgi:inner membrane protein
MTDPFSSTQPHSPSPNHQRQVRDEAFSPPKYIVIGALALATIIPSYLVSGLIAERESRQDAVQREFTQNWGPQQNLHTPILVLPYQAAPDRAWQFLKIAPTHLDVVANILPQERRRGLFHSTVYDAKVEMQGTFSVPAEARLKDFLADKDSRFLWDASFIAFGSASALTGLRSEDRIEVNAAESAWQPCEDVMRYPQDCRGAAMVLANAPLAPVTATAAKMTFKSTVSLRGTSALNVLYGGKELDVTMRSPWRTPSFGGNVLPVGSTVTSQGFESHWQTVEFGPPRIAVSGSIVDPVMWKGPTIGVELIEATPLYRTINRVAKYALLFVALSFAIYFFFELLSGVQIHVVQYGLLALSLSLFSLLLLSLSEPIGYAAGYLVSAGLVLIQSSLYTAAITRRAAPALVFAVMQAGLFGFIYVLVDLETYSLLFGALALFVVVSILMILTQWARWPSHSFAGGAGFPAG